MRLTARWIAGAALIVPGTALAQTPPDAGALKRIETVVPARDWYPAGYYDVRIAAEAEIGEAPRPRSTIVFDCYDGPGQCYDVIDCSAEGVVFNPEEPAMSRYGRTALEISRLRSELARLGYPEAVYAAPLADYEKALIAIDAGRSEGELIVDDGGDWPEGEEMPFDDGAAEAEAAAQAALAAAIDANRLRLSPKLPRVMVEGGCGAGEGGPIIVRTVPDGGEVLLINAFAFKVCTRKKADPWDRFACKWNEWETGVAQTKPYGRFVYQVKWPDGVVRKGTREIVPGPEDESVTVTFRKTGS